MGDHHELHSITSDQIALQENIFRGSTSSNAANVHMSRHSKKAFILAGFVVFLGIGCLLAGVLLITLSQRSGKTESSAESNNNGIGTPILECNTTDSNSSRKENNTQSDYPCDFSKEAKNAGLEAFFSKLSSFQKTLEPYKSSERGTYVPYNPVPETIKKFTDETRQLYEELQNIKEAMNMSRLKLREARLLARMGHELKHNFGKPYENNYYTGAWMLGPSQRCTSEPIASLQSHLSLAIYVYLTKGNDPLTDAEDFLRLLPKFAEGIKRYKTNLELGITSGMVRSSIECTQGINCMAQRYPVLFANKSATDISLWYTKSHLQNFVSRLSSRDLLQWNEKHQENISYSLMVGVVTFVGRPLIRLLEYLERNYTTYCVPNKVSSGVGTRPVDYVYINETNSFHRTNPTLTDGQTIMRGTEAYANILTYYTTTNHSPDEVYNLGWRQLNSYYRQAIDVAKEITGQANETQAVLDFKSHVNSFSLYLNKQNFPANESNKEAFRNCRTDKAASVHCPQRLSTMKLWMDTTRSTLAQLQPKLIKLFHMVGEKRTIPTCPIEVAIDFSPSRPVASYWSSISSCRFAAKYRLPFFVGKMGSLVMEWTTGAHEAIPGHHIQQQSYKEIFKEPCTLTVKLNSITAFKEGWAVYAENPLTSIDADLYKDYPLRRYGVIKSQIWRALRLIIDTGLHYKNMSRDQAISIFRHYMWDETEIIEKEVSRYQAWPGQATAYMIGQLEIWRMRNESEAKLGKKFDLRDFHYHVLSLGEVPLWFLGEYLNKCYVSCVVQGVSRSEADCSLSHAFNLEPKTVEKFK